MNKREKTGSMRIADKPTTVVRVEPNLYEKLAEIAQREKRSIGGQASIFLEKILRSVA